MSPYDPIHCIDIDTDCPSYDQERKARMPHAILAPLHIPPKIKLEHARPLKQPVGTWSTAIRNDVPAND